MGRRRKLPADPVIAEIESLGPDGRGLIKRDGRTVYLHGALPGETVQFRYTARRRRFDEGRVEQIIVSSEQRAEPECEHFAICGGCALQHLAPGAQVALKQQALLDTLAQLGNVTPAEIYSPLCSEQPWGYRRKARLGVKDVPKKGRVLVGFRERGSSLVADIRTCSILHPRIAVLLTALSDLIGGLSISNLVPQIEVAMDDDHVALIFRLLGPPNPGDLEALCEFGKCHSVSVYTQTGGPDTITPLAAPADLRYTLPDFGLSFSFLPQDFTQVNSQINRQMVNRAVELLDLSAQDTVLDLFCGIGNFSLPIAGRAGSVLGVEGDRELVARARQNAIQNAVHNAVFATANLYESLAAEPWLSKRFSRALLDPPRSGALEVLEYLPALGVERLVYVSCYPGTLARDAGKLVNEYGYRLLGAGVMDMFPHTAHVESIGVFERS